MSEFEIRFPTEIVSQTDGRSIHSIPRQHILSPECWCKPRSGTDKSSGTVVFQHRLIAPGGA